MNCATLYGRITQTATIDDTLLDGTFRTTAATEAHHVAGVWSRQWAEVPLDSGIFDRETLVHWTQAPCGIYVDIRLPHNAPGRSLEAAAAAGFSPKKWGLVADGTIMIDGETSVKRS